MDRSEENPQYDVARKPVSQTNLSTPLGINQSQLVLPGFRMGSERKNNQAETLVFHRRCYVMKKCPRLSMAGNIRDEMARSCFDVLGGGKDEDGTGW